MPFINDIAGYAWMTPAPIGYVEVGWTKIIVDLLRDIDAALGPHPMATIDVLDIAERDGELRFQCVVDGAEGTALATAVDEVVAVARTRAVATCTRCGRPGRLRADRPLWPAARCDGHADGA